MASNSDRPAALRSLVPVRMPFGKYKGFDVEDLPRSYLEWLWEHVDLYEPLRSEVEDALGHDGPRPCASSLPVELKPVAQEIISTGYRLMSMKCHPDRG